MNHESYTLLIYSNIPEDTILYLIPNVFISDEHLAFLQEAHDKVVNSDEMNTGMQFLMAALATESQNCDQSVPKEWHCIWARYRVDKDVPLDTVNLNGGVINRVFTSGFYL